MRIYVASSWRNEAQPLVVAALRSVGHEVYDFRNPVDGDDGFGWREVDGGWLDWSPEQFVRALEHPVAERGFNYDMDALRSCDACVLVLPCGRSAHLELGWAVGARRRTCVLARELPEPELMYKMVDFIALDLGDVVDWLALPPAVRFELPLRLTPTQNEYARLHWAERSRLKQEVMWRILSQCSRRTAPIATRARVTVTRYSRVAPDPDNPFSKQLLDCLKPDGLCLIRDDSADHVEWSERWEKSDRGVVVVEVRS